jgi:hypothetical protein
VKHKEHTLSCIIADWLQLCAVVATDASLATAYKQARCFVTALLLQLLVTISCCDAVTQAEHVQVWCPRSGCQGWLLQLHLAALQTACCDS